MTIVRDDLLLCDDCTIAAVNGDFTSLDYHYGTGLDRYDRKIGPSADERQAEIERGLEALGPHLVPDHDSETGDGIDEFSRRPCACCGTRLAGGRHRFAVLGPAGEETWIEACRAAILATGAEPAHVEAFIAHARAAGYFGDGENTYANAEDALLDFEIFDLGKEGTT
jgi:hypothetical protein